MSMNILRSLFLIVVLTGCATTPEPPPQPISPTVLITGANRGIGLELARQYAEKGWGVIATARNPGGADARRVPRVGGHVPPGGADVEGGGIGGES